MPFNYQDVDGVLVRWMRQHDCDAVIARPDHYVYGAAGKAEDACAMLRELAAALGAGRPQRNPAPIACV